jgi:transcriptional regulator with XRE-family HTH domain
MKFDGSKLAACRVRAGLTQQEAAVKAGLPSRMHWCDYESGRRDNPSGLRIVAMAAALGVKMEELFTEVENATS